MHLSSHPHQPSLFPWVIVCVYTGLRKIKEYLVRVKLPLLQSTKGFHTGPVVIISCFSSSVVFIRSSVVFIHSSVVSIIYQWDVSPHTQGLVWCPQKQLTSPISFICCSLYISSVCVCRDSMFCFSVGECCVFTS